jgi:hypothetical protein
MRHFEAKLGNYQSGSTDRFTTWIQWTAGTVMAQSRTARAVFEQEFLPIRAKLLEVAAALDRIDRAGGSLANDPRRTQVQAAIQVLLRPEDDRAEQLQLVFSRPYEFDWQEKLRMTNDE